MMTEKNNIYETTRNPKILKSPKGYDRVRDRKSKQIFDYEDEEDENLNDYDQEETRIF